MKTEVTCLTCTNLDNCRLKTIITNPSIKKCNYAKEGCVRYHGGLRGTDKDKILFCLQNKEVVNLDYIRNTTGLPIETKPQKQIIWNAINRLIREGYRIEKIKGNELNYRMK